MRRLFEKSRLPFRQMVLPGLLPSPLKKAIYRLKGYRIGRDVSLGFGSVLLGDSVEIGNGVSIGFLTIVRAREIRIDRYAKIGAMTIIDTGRVEIGEDARINEQVFIGGLSSPQSAFTLGKRTLIMQFSCINTYLPVEIGDESALGGHCLVFTHGSWSPETEGYPATFAPVTIGKRVWIPWRVFITAGVTIGDDAVISADSLVTRDIPARALAAGNPARVIEKEYPPPIDPEQRAAVVSRILDEFARHLEYEGCTVRRDEDPAGLTFSVGHGSTDRRLRFVRGVRDPQRVGTELVVYDDAGGALAARAGGMALDLTSRTRVGTSALGEEFANFAARYGLRFARLD